jgi:predicted MFS family arabinose efflux permease
MAGIASIADWHVAALCAAAVGLVVFLVLLARRDVLDDSAVESVVAARLATSEPVAGSQLGFLRSGAVWMCFVFFFCITAAFGVLQSYAPAILGDVYGLQLALATAALTAYLLGSAAGTLLGGFVAARTEENDRVIGLALGVSAVIALILAWGVLPGWSVIALMTCMGFGAGVAGPSRDLLVRRAATARFGKSSYGRIYGFVYSGLDVGLAATPLVFGPLLDHGRFSAALVGVAVLQCAALASAARVGRRVRIERVATGAST